MVFTPREFETFMQDVVECYCTKTQPDELLGSKAAAQRPLNLIGDPESLNPL